MEMQAKIVTPEVQENTGDLTPEQLTKNALAVVNQARDIIIATADDYSFAGLMLHEVKGWIKTLDDKEKKITKPLLLGIENTRALFRGPKQKANDVKDILNNRMVEWAEEQKRKERELQQKLEQQARKRAEEEVLKAAIEAEEAGEKEEAEQIIAEPVYVPPIRVASEIPKSKESHIRETWSAEVIDVMALVKGIAEGKVDIQAIEPNNLIKTHSFLNTMASRYKLTLNIPGVRAVSKKTQM